MGGWWGDGHDLDDIQQEANSMWHETGKVQFWDLGILGDLGIGQLKSILTGWRS